MIAPTLLAHFSSKILAPIGGVSVKHAQYSNRVTHAQRVPETPVEILPFEELISDRSNKLIEVGNSAPIRSHAAYLRSARFNTHAMMPFS